jgi:alcohol dehydrogenase (cytochrome c)
MLTKILSYLVIGVFLAGCSNAAAGPAAGPNRNALLDAGSDNANWLIPGKTYSGNRYTALNQVTPQNVSGLKKAWTTSVVDDGEEEASPIVSNGTVYLSTAHNNALALDAKTGKLKWAFGYTPSYELQYAVNRGVGLADGKVFMVTEDCRLLAIDANTGKRVFNVPACKNTSNTWYSTAAYVYKGAVIVGTSGGDLGSMGQVRAFSTQDGRHLWDFNTVPQPGEANHNTWPGTSWQHGGAAVWAGLSIDQSNDTLMIAPGNAGPNLTLYGRKGKDLYSNSVVAVDISSKTPRVKWYRQLIENDTHDADPAMPPVLFDGKVKGQTRKLLAVGDKAADFIVLDRITGAQVYRLGVSNQHGIFTTVPTLAGTFACPNHGGGIEWNGGSYDPRSNLFLIPSTQECAVWKVTTTGPVPYIPGQPYSAGPLPKRNPATGWLTAVDMNSGKIRWRKALPYAGQGGVLVTATGLAFTTDLRGRIYAYEAATGKELWHDDIGSTVVAPISAYSVDGDEYLVVMAGEGGNQQTPNLPKTHGAQVVAYRLNVTTAQVNSGAGQPSAIPSTPPHLESGSGGGPVQSLPYTQAQVQAGKSVYAAQCSSCHGANLQGVSAPALTGPSFGHAGLNVSQIRTVVTTQMPLGAPGSLSPTQYAALMAYIMSYDCIAPANGGKTPFPTTDQPAFAKVVVQSQSCPVK